MADLHFVTPILFSCINIERYEKDADEDTPTIVGFATAYPYHFHRKESPTGSDDSFFDTIFGSSPAPVPTYCRLRISQFVILPPFQRAGHGGRLYDIILQNAREDPKVQEISVEDPSEVFEDLRDRRDLKFLEGRSVFKEMKAPVSRRWVEETRKQFKMPPVPPILLSSLLMAFSETVQEST
jgi:histone acetyltransferase 1